MASINLPYMKFKEKLDSEQLSLEVYPTPDFILLLAYGPRTEWQCRMYPGSPCEAQYLLDFPPE